MECKRDAIVRAFFDFQSEQDGSVCKICKRSFKGKYYTNLKRHLHLVEFILALNKQKGQTNEKRVSSEASEISLVQLDNGLKQTSQSTCSLLNEFLNSIEVGSEGENSEEEDEPELRLATIEIYGHSPKPIDVNVDILSYWEEKKFTYPRLYCLAKVLHSVPATQVSVERAFSALSLVITDLRCNLSA